MVQTNNFTMDIFFNNQNIEIDNSVYENFIIHEIYHYSIYFAELVLHYNSPLLREYPLITGNILKFKIEVQNNYEIVEEIEMEFIIYKVRYMIPFINYILLPKIFNIIGKDKVSVGYNDTPDKIVSTICSELSLENEIETTTIEKRLFLQLNQTYFGFIKTLLSKSKNNNANYLFFIDKFNKLKFYSMSHLKTKKEVLSVNDQYVKNLIVRDNMFGYQFDMGLGAKGYYWDWDNGEVKEILYNQDKFQAINVNSILNEKIGINKEYISEYNNVVSLDPIATDIYYNLEYNNVELESNVLRKNYFNYFIEFEVLGSLKCSPAEKLNLFLNSYIKDDGMIAYTGDWMVYSVIHNFPLVGYNMKVKVSNNYLYSINDNNIY